MVDSKLKTYRLHKYLEIFKWFVYYLLKRIKFSVQKNKTLRKYWENVVKKNTGKVREFCWSGKVGIMFRRRIAGIWSIPCIPYCLFTNANFWRETSTQRFDGFPVFFRDLTKGNTRNLTIPCIPKLKLKRKTLLLTEANKQHTSVADPRFPGEGGSANPWVWGKNLLFGNIWPKTEMKEIGPRRGLTSLAPPFWSANAHYIIWTNSAVINCSFQFQPLRIDWW